MPLDVSVLMLEHGLDTDVAIKTVVALSESDEVAGMLWVAAGDSVSADTDLAVSDVPLIGGFCVAARMVMTFRIVC